MMPRYFGPYGGRYVAETLVVALEELERACDEIVLGDPSFKRELDALLRDFVGRPTPTTRAVRLGGDGIASVWLKREDLCHTGAHKINNALGQVLLAKRMGKRRIVAETGAGQHGVATATAAAVLGLPCEVYMGALDVERQAPNVARMRLLGATVKPVESGSRTLKDAMNEALRDWVSTVEHSYYCLGSAAGPAPYPSLVAELQRVIGDEARAQMLSAHGALPDAVIACVGGGSNAIGIYRAFLQDDVALYGVEAAGHGIDSHEHAATLNRGVVGILHGSKSYVLSDAGGQILEAHSISAGLDYPGVGPEHAALHDSGRVRYLAARDDEALAAVREAAENEGILIALETAHAFAKIREVGALERERRGRDVSILVCTSGRGDKDLSTLIERLG